MNVSLNSHFEKFVEEQLDGGRYNNASEVIRAGLRLLEEQELRIKELRAEIDKGFKGDEVDFDPEDIKNQGRKQLSTQQNGTTQDQFRGTQ